MDNVKITVAFDVDQTLIIQDENGQDIPRYTIIALFKTLEDLGLDMYIWSGSGVGYAQQWANKLGLKAKIRVKGSFIPDIAIDAQDVSLGKLNINADGKNEHIKVGVDCDGTLIYNGSLEYLDRKGEPLDDTPRLPILHMYELFKLMGFDMYIWSSHGKSYSKKIRKRLGLEGECLKKDKDFGMDIAIDNKDAGLAKLTLFV